MPRVRGLPADVGKAALDELFETVRYEPTLPAGTVVDEHGLPVLDPEPDDPDDE